MKNENEQAVIDAHYFSAYKNTLVIKPPIGDKAASFGVIILGNGRRDTDTVKHEYGHRVQLDNMGIGKYITDVAIPSVTANILQRKGKLPYDYYGSIWESEADRFGGVNRTTDGTPWPEGSYNSYWDLIQLFFDE